MGVVQVPEVGCIKRGTWEKRGGKGAEGLSSIPDSRRVRVTVTAHKVSTMTGGVHNFVRSAAAVRQLGNSTSGSIGLDLDKGHHQITNSKGNRGASGIDSFAVGSTTILGE
jgi:hypothetical protein